MGITTARCTVTTALAGTVLVLGACGDPEPPEATDPAPTGSPEETASPDGTGQTDPGATGDAPPEDEPASPRTVAADLPVPWGVAFRPDGSALVTLRDTGEVLQVRPGADPESLGTVPGVVADGEGGLMGIALDPQDPETVFVYLTTAQDNRVLRLSLADGALQPGEPILTGIPRATIHNGGRIAFGPDGYLYVATGDATTTGRAQDPDSLAGKILRVDTDGEPAPDNPTPGSPVWSLGHRNVQGLDWDEQGRMFASEFGQDTWDELNRIEPGHNYGWPEVEGAADAEEFTDPLHQWRPAEASPSGIAVADEHIYLAALRGQSLWRVPLAQDGTTGEPQRLLHEEYGRLRTVVSDDDGDLWLVTSNTFRGDPAPEDDRILVLDPDWLP